MNQAVILSEAKDHLERIECRKMILRFAQDDRRFEPSRCDSLATTVFRVLCPVYYSSILIPNHFSPQA